MRIAWLVPAVDAKLTTDGTMTITGGGVDTLLVDDLTEQTSLSVTLAMRVAGCAQEWMIEHVIEVTFVAEDGSQEPAYRQRLAITEAPILDPGRDIGVLVPARCDWRPRAGTFVLVVSLDGVEAARVPIAVVVQES